MGFHILIAKPDKILLHRHYCPTCEKKRFMMCWHEEWYGWNYTCLKCGERWADEERLERPFCRGWRQDSVRRAKRFYRKHKVARQVNESR